MQEENTFEDKLSRLYELVGMFSVSKNDLVRDCFEEDEAGVWRLAMRVSSRAGQFTSPQAVFLKNLINGEHKGPRRLPDHRKPRPLVYPKVSEAEQARYGVLSDQWALIKQHVMQDKRINELFHELKAICRDPENPTNEEGRRTREALIYAIHNP